MANTIVAGYGYVLICTMNSATFFLISVSVNSNSAAIRFASARSAMLCGREMGGSVGKGYGDSQVAASMSLGGVKDVGE